METKQHALTAGELIEKLKMFSADTPVVIETGSDCEVGCKYHYAPLEPVVGVEAMAKLQMRRPEQWDMH